MSWMRKLRLKMPRTDGKMVVDAEDEVESEEASSEGSICSQRAWVGCIVLGYIIKLVWMSYTPLMFSRRRVASSELKRLRAVSIKSKRKRIGHRRHT